ncbi:MAG: hypothetical protein OYG31_00455 [Candidatus Kaiserbacteria bacterium]|nr:hypothetical protein [Candidatus Kaiserbacteria bacterium]
MNGFAQILRLLGIVITALAIPVSLLTLFGLSGLPESDPLWIKILCVVWAFVNFVALPFILAGFAMRYTFDLSVHFAAVLFGLISLVFILVLTEMVPGSLPSVAFLALPPSLYLIGCVFNKQSKS